MINYSFYPILEGAGRSISELDEQTILYARDNIEKYKPTKLEDIDMTVWLVSTIILHNLKNNFLIRKFVTNYGKLMESHFLNDIKDKEVREAILYHLNVFKDLRTVDKNRISLHMTDYLEIALVVSDKYPHFKLVNCDVDSGHVHMDIPKFVYLVRLVVEKLLFDRIKVMNSYYENETINNIVGELSGKYIQDQKKHISSKNSTIPQTIKELIDLAYNTHQLNHSQRIKLGIYLQAQEYEWDYIIDIFSQLSDFNLKTTTYQLKSLRKYIKP